MSHALVQRYLLCLCLFGLLALGCAQPLQDHERIVGGRDTDISVYPHQISLRRKAITAPRNSFSHICGGSIVADNIIVTAAHCIIGSVPSQYKVVGGTSRRNEAKGAVSNVREIIMHEQYNPDNYDNDIALLVLREPLPLNNFTMRAIRLASKAAEAGEISSISGWGTKAPGGYSADQLVAAQVPIVSNEDCNKDYGAGRITSAMLCAGYRGTGGVDACQGDSGGPLIIDNELHGVVSWGYSCALPSHPGVYASVHYMLPWLQAKIAAINKL
ncbi:trypsin zeta-like [Drosophila busckii]|uniref:trypsin zeta-like n=1 Tax=Drosophila busckii TaxID=30019 RepID=UPI00083EBA64|nr:trypsin zeta-like [Drosophila busckii]